MRLGRHTFADDELLVMAIVNRTPDSFYDRGATYAEEAALRRVDEVVAAGADIVDIGGVRAAPGEDVGIVEEIDRVVGIVAAVRERHPEVVVSVDTWRTEVAEEVCAAGADVINDSWGGVDRRLVGVVAEHDVALICTHVGGQAPRTRPFRTGYGRDVVEDVLAGVCGYAERALAAGVARESIVIDPAHDFGKNSWHTLEVTRRLDDLTATGWPVLVSMSNKDFVGETLDRPLEERLIGTLATTAIAAWLGARIYRVHEVDETRQVLDMVATIDGRRPPARTIRGLA